LVVSTLPLWRLRVSLEGSCMPRNLIGILIAIILIIVVLKLLGMF
jgi:hypothetical protein